MQATMRTFQNVSMRTARLRLRPLHADDAGALFEMYADPRVSRFLSRRQWQSIDQAHELIKQDAQAHATGQYLRLGIERAEDAVVLGECSLHNLDLTSKRAEIGYALRASAWGHGYVSEALAPLVRFAFVDLDLNRLEADTDPRNSASAKVLQRLGFTLEGRLRARWIVAGETSDSAIYGLLRDEWLAGVSRGAGPAET
jgi:RimJ/RimL family protein N-acetyltransferase